METIKDLKITIEKLVKDSEQVFISPHIKVDFDTIASAIGMALIIKKLGKTPYIILDEVINEMEVGVKKIIEEIINNCNDKENMQIINSDKYLNIKDNNDLLITVDLNKNHLTSCQSYLDNFKNILIIDHHNEDDKTINTKYKYINVNVSSVSEIIIELLCCFNIKYDKRIADYLLAGIYLDTDSLKRNVTAKTYKMIAKLFEKGADIGRVNDLFVYDFGSDRKVQELIGKADFLTYTYAIALADEEVIYTREELAKVADYLSKYTTDAAFSIGHVTPDEISISARSVKGMIDVGEVMQELGGGGSPYSAATKITGQSVNETKKVLTRILKPKFYKNINDDDNN